jgi:hypothetical protein
MYQSANPHAALKVMAERMTAARGHAYRNNVVLARFHINGSTPHHNYSGQPTTNIPYALSPSSVLILCVWSLAIMFITLYIAA